MQVELCSAVRRGLAASATFCSRWVSGWTKAQPYGGGLLPPQFFVYADIAAGLKPSRTAKACSLRSVLQRQVQRLDQGPAVQRRLAPSAVFCICGHSGWTKAQPYERSSFFSCIAWLRDAGGVMFSHTEGACSLRCVLQMQG